MASLVAASIHEGFRFVERLASDWQDGSARFDQAGELFLTAFHGQSVIAIGGLTADPYTGDPALGRLRHVYVRPDARRRGLGRRLVTALESAARHWYRAVVLRTDSQAAARFYEALGYERLPVGGTATHRRELRLRRDGDSVPAAEREPRADNI